MTEDSIASRERLEPAPPFVEGAGIDEHGGGAIAQILDRKARMLLIEQTKGISKKTRKRMLDLLLNERSDIWKPALNGLGLLLDQGGIHTREALEAACARCRDRGDAERAEWIQEVLDDSMPSTSIGS